MPFDLCNNAPLYCIYHMDMRNYDQALECIVNRARQAAFYGGIFFHKRERRPMLCMSCPSSVMFRSHRCRSCDRACYDVWYDDHKCSGSEHAASTLLVCDCGHSRPLFLNS